MHSRLDDASEYSRHFPPQNAETDIALGEASWYDDARQSKLPPAPKGKAPDPQYEVLEQCREVRDDEVPEPSVVRYRPGIDTFLADFFALTVPIAFLIFVIILVSKSGHKADVGSIQQWKDAAYVLSTLFPLLFAAIVGRLMTQAARCKLENGSTIETLEQLMGSRTVGGVFVTQFQLRALNILGLSLLLLWCISPLGAQSILRLVEVGNAAETTSRPMMYFDTLGSSPSDNELPPFREHEASVQNATFDRINALYNSVILAPLTIKNNTMDMWGNVKIPFLSSLEKSGDDEWQSNEPGTEMLYSSLVGLPVLNISSGNTTFEAESTYIELDCAAVENLRTSGSIERKPYNSTWLGRLASSSADPPPNGTFQGFRLGGNGSIYNEAAWTFAIDRFINHYWLYTTESRGMSTNYQTNASLQRLRMFENETGIEAGPTTLMLEAYISSALTQPLTYLGTSCDVKQKYVTSQITCSKLEQVDQQNCSVTAQRPSRTYKMPESLNILNFPEAMYIVSKFWPVSSGQNVARIGVYDITLQYLADPALNTTAYNMSSVDAKTFSYRLSQVLNTFIQIASMDVNALRLGDSGSTYLEKNQTASAEVDSPVNVFSIPKLWAAFSIASGLILLIAGVASVFFVHWAVGPEVLGYATTALRNNPLVSVPESAMKMDGIELAVQLRQRRVRFGFAGTGSTGGSVVGVSDENLTDRFRDMIMKR
ncbi:unnamed protein product [Clonostachys byssicola]|uniref:Uncharacterized protein n=1 Tax=Clonostachys byssicola TaxID=160290 RepID=A0A9N9Y4I3_9HYPO|nr:unnamed protein product [Clonostachys byssicola]